MALDGLKVVEFAGLAPAPFAGLVLAHHGASVVRIDRPSTRIADVLCEGKRSIVLDTKNAAGLAVAKQLITQADVLIDPFRPGVLERLGLGPQVFHDGDKGKGLNDRLVYARIAGFPRDGPHHSMAGHDINYIALSGILSMLPGSKEKPTFPLNLLADFAGGGLLCATGILLALIERAKSGRGQVVNVDMVTGTRYISSFPLLDALGSSRHFPAPRGFNMLDGGAPFYDIYTCSDGKWMSVGCLEPQFFAEFINRFNAAIKTTGMTTSWVPTHDTRFDRENWPRLKKYIKDGFETMPRDFWADVFHGTDACTVPVLSVAEATQVDPTRSIRPAPHPHLSRTPASIPFTKSAEVLEPGTHTEEILTEMGISKEEKQRLASEGAFGKEIQNHAKTRSKL